MDKKRRYERFNVEIMNITGRVALSTITKIRGIDGNRLHVCADVRMDIGKEYNLKLQWGDTSLTVRGVVESSLLGESIPTSGEDIIPLYCAEIHFKEITGESRELINKLIPLYHQEEELKFSKFKVSLDGQQKTGIDIGEDYRVKKISLGGMLIECAHAQEVGSIFPMTISLFDHAPLTIMGRVASCAAVGDGHTGYDIGIEFRDLSGKNKERLKEFIRMLENTRDTQ